MCSLLNPPTLASDVDRRIGRRLRQRRRALGISLDEVAAACDVGFQQIQKYESGLSRVPAARLWEAAKLLGVPMSYFFACSTGEDG